MKSKNESVGSVQKYLNSSVIEAVRSIAIDAGLVIMAVYKHDFDVYKKNDDSPVTEADLAAHNIIVTSLKNTFPELPVLSEESDNIEFSERKHWVTFWMVDPLDGTKEFIKKNDEFTVNIALIHQGRPVLGVVHAPALGVTYFGCEGIGALKCEVGEEKAITANQCVDDSWTVVGSRSHQNEETDEYLSAFPEYELISKGSSLKLCMVAEGTADLYPKLGPTCEWDTAAGHAVVNAAGGVVNDQLGRALQYNKENILNPWFFAHGRLVAIPSPVQVMD